MIKIPWEGKKVGRESHLLEEELSHFLLNRMSALRYFKNNHSSTPRCVGRALVLFLIEKYTDTFLQKVMPSYELPASNVLLLMGKKMRSKSLPHKD